MHFVLPVTMGCVIDLFRPGLHRPLEEESLGEQTMHGLRVEGTRVSGMLNFWLGPGSTMDERWFSPELKLEMHARSEDEQIGVVEYQCDRDQPRRTACGALRGACGLRHVRDVPRERVVEPI